MIEQELKQALAERARQSLYRNRKVMASAQGSDVSLSSQAHDGDFINFASNDYLGLANHPDVTKAFVDSANKFGVGSGASHLVIGHHQEHHLLEQELAEFTGRERALVFSNGYAANLSCLNVLLGQGDLVAEDKLNHASLLDGGLSSGAKFRRYIHNDITSLDKTLSLPGNRKIVVTDGVFSMDGDCAPLADIITTAKSHDAWLMVDDAHGFGVLGKTGAGLCEQLQLSEQQVPILVGTFGKAFGTYGAFVAGSETLIETLIQFARPYIYSTALPPAIAAATRQALKIIQQGAELREKLQSLIQLFRTRVSALDFDLMDSSTAIQPLVIGDEQSMLNIAEFLKANGILVGAIRPPTVPKGTARLRITLTAAHTPEQVERLTDLLAQAYEQFCSQANESLAE